MYQFVSNITLKGDTYNIEQEYNPPLIFDVQRYNYFIKILNVRFSNNVPNITKALTFSIDGLDVVTIDQGIYEIADIIDIVNPAISTNNIVIAINDYNGHLSISNNDNSDHVIGGSLIESIQFGQFASSVTVQANTSVTSPEMCQVSDSNFFKLCSTSISPTSYESQGDKLIIGNTLYTFAATIEKFGHKDFTAFQDIAYPLYVEQLNRLDFQLTDEHGNSLTPIAGAKSDFNIQAIICCTPKV